MPLERVRAFWDWVANPPHAAPNRDRGQAIQVGVALFFLFAAMAYTIAVTQTAPTIQEDTEQRHSQQLLADMQTMQSDMIKVAATGQRQSHTAEMGARYPWRAILLHPPDPSSSIFNLDDLNLEVQNAEAVDEETRDFLGGGTLSYTSTSLNMQPNYAQYDEAPIYRLEHGTLYADYTSQQELSSHGGVISGRNINLPTLEGDLNYGTTNPLNIQQVPLSASSQTVSIQDTGSPVQFRIETHQSLEMWEEVLGDEISTGPNDGRYIQDLRMNNGDPNELIIEMVPGEVYQLNMARVGVRRGGQVSFSSDDVPDVAYVTAVSNTDPIIGEEQSMDLAVQTRDSFHNPSSSVQVDASANRGTITSTTPTLTDSSGYATFRYEAPEITAGIGAVSSQSDTVTVEVVGESGAQWEIEYNIEVQNTHS